MTLWIRTQDKNSLIKVNEIHLHEHREDGGCEIIVVVDNCEMVVATYSNKERALEVLDEIEDTLATTNYTIASAGIVSQTVQIYSMPSK